MVFLEDEEVFKSLAVVQLRIYCSPSNKGQEHDQKKKQNHRALVNLAYSWVYSRKVNCLCEYWFSFPV